MSDLVGILVREVRTAELLRQVIDPSRALIFVAGEGKMGWRLSRVCVLGARDFMSSPELSSPELRRWVEDFELALGPGGRLEFFA